MKTYNTKQANATTMMTASGGMSAMVTMSGAGWINIVPVIGAVSCVVMLGIGLSYLRYKAHLTTKRLVFVAPKAAPREIRLKDINAICVGEGKLAKTLYIDIGDGDPGQYEIKAMKHQQVADEIARQARACGAKLK